MRCTNVLRLGTAIVIALIALKTGGKVMVAAQNASPSSRGNPNCCRHEPDWRPTHMATLTLHVKEVKVAIITVVIDCLGASADPRCDITKIRDSRWKPKTGDTYIAEVTYRPEHFNPCANFPMISSCEQCLGKESQATRTVCIGPLAPQIQPRSKDVFDAFYKWSQKHDSICYAVSTIPSESTF
jgi:hypothetical protein